MFKKILVAVDGSEGSNIALHHAAILARMTGATLTAIWAKHGLPHFPETVDEVAVEQEAAESFFLNLKKYVLWVEETHGRPIQIVSAAGHPAQQILEQAQAGHFDLVVLGSRGHSRLWGQLLGHTADRVNEQAPCSVLIVRSAKEEAHYRKMLIGFDGSESSAVALECGLDLAKKIGSEVHVLWIHPKPASPYETRDEERLNESWVGKFFETSIKKRIEQAAFEHEIKVTSNYRIASPAQALVAEAETGGFRLIVLGHQGHSRLWGRLLGGTADRVSHHAHCDVLIVRPAASAP